MTFLNRAHTARALRLSAAGAAILTLTACGGTAGGEGGDGGSAGGGQSEGASAGEAWKKARAQVEKAESFRVTIEDETQGQKATVELAGQVKDKNSEMSVKSEGEKAMETTLREVDDKTYMQSPELGGDKWMEQEVPEGEGGFMKQFQQDMLDGLPAADALKDVDSKREEVEVEGQKGYRYAVPENIESAKQADSSDKGESEDAAGDTATNMSNVSAFVVNEDDELIALEIDESRGQDQGDEASGDKKSEDKKSKDEKSEKGKDEKGQGDEVVEVRLSDWDSVEKVEAPKKDEIMSAEDMKTP